jgi:hypothetical protein
VLYYFNGGFEMKSLGLILVVVVAFSGCAANFQRSEVLETDKFEGYASGTYRDSSSGPNMVVGLAGGGGGWGAVGAGGAGALGMLIKTGPPDSEAYKFARAIATINYSKRLKAITYDETGRIVEYEFEQRPLGKSSSYRAPAPPPYSKSFGFQPVE